MASKANPYSKFDEANDTQATAPPPTYNEATGYSKWETDYSGYGSQGQPPPPSNVVLQEEQQRKQQQKGAQQCLFWISLVLVLACAGLLIGLGVTHIEPYLDVRGFSHGICNVTNSTIDYENRHKCGCGKHCSSSYPCLIIKVNVTKDDGIHIPEELTLYDHERELEKRVIILATFKLYTSCFGARFR